MTLSASPLPRTVVLGSTSRYRRELLSRLHAQLEMPPSKMKVCRGRVFSPRDYITDITEWGYADMTGRGLEERHDPIY